MAKRHPMIDTPLAAIILVVGALPVAIWFRERTDVAPADAAKPQRHKIDVGSFIKDSRFWWFMGALTLAAIPLGGFMTQLAPIALEKGLSVTDMTLITMTYAISVCIGRAGGGLMLDRFWDGGVACALLTLSGLGGLLLYFSTDLPVMFAFIAALLVGMGHGAEADFAAYFTLKLFGFDRFATIFGVYSLFLSLGLSGGALSFAAIFDAQKSYDHAILIGAFCYALSGWIIMLLRLSERRKRAASMA